MKGFWRGESCYIGVGGMTRAMEAEDILRGMGICARLASAQEVQGRGCAYGITYPCHREDEVVRILRENGFRLRGRSERG